MSSLGMALIVVVTYVVLLGPFYMFRFRVWGGAHRKQAMSGLSKTDRATLTDLLKRLGTTAEAQRSRRG